jgi:hypothetical protein
MNEALTQAARAAGLAEARHEGLRLAFGLACVQRVEHLLEDPHAVECLATLRDFVEGRADAQALTKAREVIADVANRHRGSPSIDGAAHAAVSATYAVANAIAGRALEAASYAAYASVYAYGGYAVNDPGAFENEFRWQADKLRQLVGAVQDAGTPPT